MQGLNRSKVRGGMLIIFYLEGVSREQRLNASGERVFSRLTTYPYLIFGVCPRFSTDFDLMIAKKGAFSSFGVFNFQRLPETFSAQLWCAAVVTLKFDRPPLCTYAETCGERRCRLLAPIHFYVLTCAQ